MKALQTPPSIRFIVLFSALVLGISSCRFPTSHSQDMRTLFLPAARVSVLVIITNPDSPSDMRAAGALLTASARPREQVIILSSRDGTILASSQAPDSLSVRVPAPPGRLTSNPTSFQKARYWEALQHYRSMVLRAGSELQTKEQRALAAWAESTMAKAASRPTLQSTTHTVSISGDLSVAVSDLSSLRQAGMGVVNTVIVIEGVTGTIVRSVPTPVTGLQGSTVVIPDFPGTTNDEAAWQASLVQSGAARAVMLTPAIDGQLIPVVRQGLDGAVTDTLTSVLFGLGQYKLQAAALPQLRRLLYLLTVEYPHATASINGYTDSLPVPGGNLHLSWQRAQEVAEWLIAQGVAVERLQIFGYGDIDPIAPDTPKGQLLNRRVVVVIDPAVST
jgi:outer membrane protein OmpA-like peptidoglycan-associated protein